MTTYMLGETTIAACEIHGISFEELTARKRYPRVVEARQWLWRELHDRHGWSYSELARETGYDHTTVIHGVKRARAVEAREEKAETVEQFEARMGWAKEAGEE